MIYYKTILITVMLLLSISVSSAEIVLPLEWKGKNIIIEKTENIDKIITIHYKDKLPNKQNILYSNPITNNVYYGTFKYFSDGQAFGYIARWNLSSDINNIGILKYYVNPTGSGIDPIQTVEAIKESMNKWDDNVERNLIEENWNPYTTTFSPHIYRDGKNVIGWDDLTQIYPFAIAVAFTWVDHGTHEIMESDIILNSEFPWGISAEGECTNDNFMDIQNIATHELGHFYGLLDFYLYNNTEITMYGYSYYGETSKRSLEFGDIYGIKTLYEFNNECLFPDCSTPTPPTPPPQSTPGILKNPYFTEGSFPDYIPSTKNWIFYTNGQGTFDAITKEPGLYVGRVNIISKGTNTQVYQTDVNLEPYTWYNLSFDTYNIGSVNQSFDIVLFKHGTPYTNYGLNSRFTIPYNSYNTFSTKFKTTGFSSNVTDGRFMIYFNNNGVYQFTKTILEKSEIQ